MTDRQAPPQPNPKTRIYGDGQWEGWWTAPVAVILVTLVAIVAAVVVQGPGADSGSPAANQTVTRPTSAP